MFKDYMNRIEMGEPEGAPERPMGSNYYGPTTPEVRPTQPAHVLRDPELTEDAVRNLIRDRCDEIKELLLRKNAGYGNSAIQPERIFSDCDPIQQLKVRIDDKLTRVKRRKNSHTRDTRIDLIGYLILLDIAEEIYDTPGTNG